MMTGTMLFSKHKHAGRTSAPNATENDAIVSSRPGKIHSSEELRAAVSSGLERRHKAALALQRQQARDLR